MEEIAKNKLVSGLLDTYIQEVKNEFDQIDAERKALLKKFADYISIRLQEEGEISLNFICTHNSRRSHLTQIWAQTAACYYNFKNVSCYSGGTEATAFFPAAVKAIKKTGLKVLPLSEGKNPVYAIKYCSNSTPLICFSKTYDDAFNADENYTAIMTCDNADQNCPFIPEASARFPIKYQDPKVSDGTDQQEKIYDERCKQIAREMFYAFSKVK